MEKKVSNFKKVFEAKWFSIEATLKNFSNNEPYFRFTCNDSVQILAVTPDEKIILVKQYRPPLESHTLELPAGYVKENELPEEAIIGEFKEETGFVCDSIKFLGSLRIASSRINNMLYVYFGQNAEITDTVDKDQKN